LDRYTGFEETSDYCCPTESITGSTRVHRICRVLRVVSTIKSDQNATLNDIHEEERKPWSCLDHRHYSSPTEHFVLAAAGWGAFHAETNLRKVENVRQVGPQ